jgi:hypothetical protein
MPALQAREDESKHEKSPQPESEDESESDGTSDEDSVQETADGSQETHPDSGLQNEISTNAVDTTADPQSELTKESQPQKDFPEFQCVPKVFSRAELIDLFKTLHGDRPTVVKGVTTVGFVS